MCLYLRPERESDRWREILLFPIEDEPYHRRGMTVLVYYRHRLPDRIKTSATKHVFRTAYGLLLFLIRCLNAEGDGEELFIKGNQSIKTQQGEFEGHLFYLSYWRNEYLQHATFNWVPASLDIGCHWRRLSANRHQRLVLGYDNTYHSPDDLINCLCDDLSGKDQRILVKSGNRIMGSWIHWKEDSADFIGVTPRQMNTLYLLSKNRHETEVDLEHNDVFTPVFTTRSYDLARWWSQNFVPKPGRIEYIYEELAHLNRKQRKLPMVSDAGEMVAKRFFCHLASTNEQVPTILEGNRQGVRIDQNTIVVWNPLSSAEESMVDWRILRQDNFGIYGDQGHFSLSTDSQSVKLQLYCSGQSCIEHSAKQSITTWAIRDSEKPVRAPNMVEEK